MFLLSSSLLLLSYISFIYKSLIVTNVIKMLNNIYSSEIALKHLKFELLNFEIQKTLIQKT